jgi:hypothetical protein
VTIESHARSESQRQLCATQAPAMLKEISIKLGAQSPLHASSVLVVNFQAVTFICGNYYPAKSLENNDEHIHHESFRLNKAQGQV